MASTFTYTGSATYTAIGQAQFPIIVQPPPGHLVTSYVITLGAPMPCNFINLQWIQAGGTNSGSQLLGGQITQGNTTDTESGNVIGNADSTSHQLKASIGSSCPGALTVNFTAQVTYADAGPPPACAYGAQPNPSAAVYTYVTDVLVEGVAAALGMGPLGLIALGTMIGAPVIFPTCSSVPALPPALVDADFIDGTGLPNPLHLDKWLQNFAYGVWMFYCECKPATGSNPPPVNPPVPVLPPRLQPGPQPPSPCVDTDVCTTLNRITNILTTINLTMQNNTYVEAEPGYTWGTSYPNLSGNGEIAVSGILGVAVSFSTKPARLGTTIGDPNTIWNAGWVTFGSPDGWYPRQFITSDPWLILPTHMMNISRVGYSIPNDCVVSIQLLVAAPMHVSAVAGT